MSDWHPDYKDDRGLNPTETVFEVKEKKFSAILDKDGDPIPYKSKKLGHVGFFKLKERT